METDTYGELLKKVDGSDFDAFKCIYELRENFQNIGVSHFLVRRLYKYSYLELEFYIPQFIQLLVSFESDSMALSDFILDYSRKYPHFCLITFWHLQSYMFELKDNYDSYSFQIVRSFINEIQNIMFNLGLSGEDDKRFQENVFPALVFAGTTLGIHSLPGMANYIRPVVASQSRQQKSFLFRLANFHKGLTKNLTMKNKAMSLESGYDSTPIQSRNSEGNATSNRSSLSLASEEEKLTSYSDTDLIDRSINVNTKIKSKKSVAQRSRSSEDNRVLNQNGKSKAPLDHSKLVSHSLPDLNQNKEEDFFDLTPTVSNSSSISIASTEINDQRLMPQKALGYEQKVKHLQVNYFKKETDFIMALLNISARLSQVPNEARLTTLRAELAIINSTLLPSEIDIPFLLPVSSKQNKKFHRILKLNVNEACVLNSAERVPYLLLIEYLSEEMDFDPLSEHNKGIIFNRTNSTTRSPLDLQKERSSPRIPSERNSFEEDLGDISMVTVSNEQNLISHHIGLNKVNEARRTNQDKSDNLRNDLNVHFSSTAASSESFNQLSTKDLSAQMRIATVMLQQLDKSGQSGSSQATSIKTRIIDSMKALQDKFEHIDYNQINELNSVNIGQSVPDAGERKLENDFKLGEDWATKKNRIRKSSAYGNLKNWELCSVIAKNGDDLPQEAFACQLISIISRIWKTESVGAWTKNMKILVTSSNSGLVETINNAMSIHSIKKSLTEISIKNGDNLNGTVATVKDYFLKVYGSESSSRYKKAQDNFSRSLAAYSIICYVLQIKDRHNGNIMLDNEGHIIHIDFGFLLSNSPGSVGFEAAPFKLTQEYVDVLGGVESRAFSRFKELCKSCFRTLRQNHEKLVNIVDLMQKDSGLPCFRNGAQTGILLKQRLRLELNDDESDNFVETILIGKSIGSVYTRLYDQFQLVTQGIYS